MDKGEDSFYEFVKIVLKCFLILLFFCGFLPELLNLIIFKLTYFNREHENSTFVSNIFYTNKLFIYKYIYIVKSFLSF